MANSKELIRFQPEEDIRSTYDSHIVGLCFGPSGLESSVRSRSVGKSGSGTSRLSTAGRVPTQRVPGWVADSSRDSSSHCSRNPDEFSLDGSDTTVANFRTSKIMGRNFDRDKSSYENGRKLTAGRVPQQRLPGWLSESCNADFSEGSQRSAPTSRIDVLSCDTEQEFPALPTPCCPLSASCTSKKPLQHVGDDTHAMHSKSSGLQSRCRSNNVDHDDRRLQQSGRLPALPKLPNLEACKMMSAEQGKTAGEMMFAHDFRKSMTPRTGVTSARTTASNGSSCCHSARTSSLSTRASSCSTGRRSENWRFHSATSDLLTDNCLLPWKL